MRRIAGASYCPLPLSQAVLVERVNTKSTRRGIFWGRALAICTEIRRRSRLCRLRGATHACSRARIICLQVHAEPERLQPAQSAASQKGIVHMRLNQRLLFRLCHTGTAEQVHYSHYDFSSLLCLVRYSFLLAMPNWTHASRRYK